MGFMIIFILINIYHVIPTVVLGLSDPRFSGTLLLEVVLSSTLFLTRVPEERGSINPKPTLFSFSPLNKEKLLQFLV